MQIPIKMTEDELIIAYDAYCNRSTVFRNFKACFEREREETRVIREARNLFISEASQNLLVGRRENLEMDSPEYMRMIKNAQLEIDAAEKLDRMLNNELNRLNLISDNIATSAEGVGEFISDIILKSPSYQLSSKVGVICGKMLGKTTRR